VSQESSSDVVQEALRLGALGYVAKIDASVELLAAVEAVCQGRQFVSAALVGHVPTELADMQSPKGLHPDQVLASETGRLKFLFRGFLPGGTPGIASRTERHASADRRATLGLRFD
jgi:hypothetical protein